MSAPFKFPPSSEREGFLWAAELLSKAATSGKFSTEECLALGYLVWLAARSVEPFNPLPPPRGRSA